MDDFSAMLDTLQQQGGGEGGASPAQSGEVLDDLDRRLSSLKRKVGGWKFTCVGCVLLDIGASAQPPVRG